MKIRTAVIGIAVTAALVGAAGYGAYYSMQGSRMPVEVVPVSNVSMSGGYYGQMQVIYGSVTSQVAQTVHLNEDYPIDEIFVEAGEQVREGTPLFSYDMTLQELELEMEQLNLQTSELTMTRLERDLEKYKNTRATASLEADPFVLTASAEEMEETAAEEAEILEPQTSGSGGEEGQEGDGPDSEDPAESSGGLTVADVETVDGGEAGDSEQLSIVDSVISYEQLVSAIDSLFRLYGDELRSEEIRGAIEEAVAYYRRNLADEKLSVETAEDGTETEVCAYELRDSVREALGEEDSGKLAQFAGMLDGYQVQCVQMQIAEAEGLDGAPLAQAVAQIRASCSLLATRQREQVENLDALRAMEQRISAQEQTESGAGTEDDGQQQGGQTEESESEAEQATEPAQTETSRQKYTLTIRYPAEVKEQHLPGDIVNLQADTGDVTLAFAGWKITPLPEGLSEEDLNGAILSFLMPEADVTATAQYRNVPDQIESYVQAFLADATELLAAGAQEAFAQRGDNFLTRLEDTVVFYQQWLGEPPDEIVDLTKAPTMEDYLLKENVEQYLVGRDSAQLVQQLKDSYRELCLLYTESLFTQLDPGAVDRDMLDKAQKAYDNLGDSWREELEARWQRQQEDTVPETDEYGEPLPSQTAALSIGDTLGAYQVMCRYQEYLQMDPNTPEGERYRVLQSVWEQYAMLSPEQQMLVAGDPTFAATMQQYGLWQDLTEPDTEFPGDYGDYGDWGDDEPGYTASELRQLIEDTEQEIKSCALDIREIELELKRKQRIVDGKIVKSTMDGVVVSIGGADGDSDEDYFVKVANETGLYAKGTMSELALEKIRVGDTISGMLVNTGAAFTAVIKEISEYPDTSDSYRGWGSDNSYASYYPFYALIEDGEDIQEGEAEMQLSATANEEDTAIYLENFFVRTENDGRNYVFREGDDGTLIKQYVTVGKKLDSYAVEIAEGLSLTDRIAFPYGKNVVEGAKTKEVDMLQDAYM